MNSSVEDETEVARILDRLRRDFPDQTFEFKESPLDRSIFHTAPPRRLFINGEKLKAKWIPAPRDEVVASTNFAENNIDAYEEFYKMIKDQITLQIGE